MTDHDDDVARRYRALPREEPPPALDAAILAHSRRAVAARPGGLRRWSGPLSIAAVLVLAVGIVSRMQVEQPGIETSAPASVPPPPPAESRAEAAPQAKAEMAAPQPAPKPKAAARVEQRVARDAEAPTAQPEPQSRGPAPQAITIQGAAPPPPQPFRPDERVLNVQRAKVAASAAPAAPAAESVATDSAPLVVEESPDATLERIVRLRAEARHDEADRALEQFRKRYPDYRIPEATLKRVLRPTP